MSNQPANGLLALPIPLFLMQCYMQLGDQTAASVALYGVTAALPLLMAWQVWRSVRSKEGLARGWANLVAALHVLQWCAVLAGWGMCRSRCGDESRGLDAYERGILVGAL